MLGKIKKAIQDKLCKECIIEYEDALQCQTDPYLMWIRETELLTQKEGEEESYPDISVVYMQQCGEKFNLNEINKDIIIFASREGKISVNAFREVKHYFEKHPDVNILYADEDVWFIPNGEDEEPDNELRHRISPWTKPMWSPDTLLSFQYFGNIFAIRRKAYLGLKWLGMDDYRMNLYDFLLKATEQGKRPGHIEKILFHAYRKGESKTCVEQEVMNETKFTASTADYNFIREMAFERRSISGKMVVDEATGYSYPLYSVPGEPLVSIIIPSKDNVDVLKQCITSIYEHTEYKNFEIVVVDNGSTAQARMRIEGFRSEYDFKYLYNPMEFNFSKMCNFGVENSNGSYILLLNDDMEVIQGDWLTRMIGQASLKYVGAVGAKLLYPNTTLIQHAGITNTISGPGHKLKQKDDSLNYYYGHNKLNYDMIGVTAACLMIRKDLYVALGGLYEGLEVAYNDVDLCFRICEKGLYNVQRNDVVLYHHESLSRGDDMQDKVKFERLMREKDILYKRHIKLYRQDPFNGTIMNDGSPDYQCRWFEGYELADMVGYHDEVREGKRLPNKKNMNQAIMIVVEDCGKDKFYRVGSKKKPYYIIKGWAYVPGVDNARYKFKLLLINEKGKVWEIPVVKRYRKDVAAILPDETNVEMAGFCCWIYEGSLPEGTYDLWMTAKDSCSRQRLYRSAEKQLIV